MPHLPSPYRAILFFSNTPFPCTSYYAPLKSGVAYRIRTVQSAPKPTRGAVDRLLLSTARAWAQRFVIGPGCAVGCHWGWGAVACTTAPWTTAPWTTAPWMTVPIPTCFAGAGS